MQSELRKVKMLVESSLIGLPPSQIKCMNYRGKVLYSISRFLENRILSSLLKEKMIIYEKLPFLNNE